MALFSVLPGWGMLRQAGRRLRRSPGYAASVIAVLALCIGGVTAIFSVVYGVLLEPYGFEQPGKLIVWHETAREFSAQFPMLPVNYRHFEYVAAHADDLASAALVQPNQWTVSVRSGHPVQVSGMTVGPEFFDVLGTAPMEGRAFLPQESQAGRDREVILSAAAASRFFGESRGVEGRVLTVDGVPRTVVGVMRADFRFPALSLVPGASTRESTAYAIYMPLVPMPEELTESEGDFNYVALGRLRPGVSVSAAQAELDGLDKRSAVADHLSLHLGVTAEAFSDEVVGGVSKSLTLLLLAVGGVLIVGCVNLANLQLAHSVAQSGEQALRSALGASRLRVMGEALRENLLLASAGLLLAVPLAWAGVRLLVAIAPPGLPRLANVRLSLPVLAVAVVLSLFTSLLFGLLPAWRAAHVNPATALGSISSRASGEPRGASRIRRGLLVVEIACSLILLAATGMLARSFGQILTSARGLGAEPVTMAEVDLDGPKYSKDADRIAMIQRSLATLRALPGVRDAAITSVMPLTGSMSIQGILRPDHPLPPGRIPLANSRIISPDYFSALDIPIVAGRAFSEADLQTGKVAIVSQATAREAWPEENPVGRPMMQRGQTYTVVGIAADARINDPKEDAPVFYLPFSGQQSVFLSSPIFLIRGNGVPASEIRKAIWSIDPQVAIPTLLPIHVQTEKSLAVDRFQTILVGSFGLAGLLLTALGVYGVLGYGVNLRMREWGVRMALGSSRGQLLGRVLLDAGRPALAGAVLGVIGALAAGRWLRSLLYGARASDVPVLAGSVLLLGVAVLLAALPAARRAAAAEPAAILRGE